MSTSRRTSSKLPLVTMKLDDIIPYWRNPRRITDESVNAVAESLRRYGYQQPIVVDESNVIVIGHTRYAALRRIGVTEIPVLVAKGLSPVKIKELRVVDNRTHEYGSWDFTQLVNELSELDAELMQSFFPEVAMGPVAGDTGGADSFDLNAKSDVADVTKTESSAEFICPSCFHSWEMNVTESMIRKGRLQLS